MAVVRGLAKESRIVFVLAVLGLFLVTGCIAPESGPSTSTGQRNDSAEADEAVIAYDDCIGVKVTSPVRSSEAAAFLPPGFAPAPFGPTPGFTPLVTYLGRCANVSADGKPVPGSTRFHGFVILSVIPPTASGASVDIVALRWLVGSEEELAAYARSGLTNGEVADGLVSVVDAPGGGAWQGAASVSTSTFALTMDSVTPPDRETAYVFRLFDITGATVGDGHLPDYAAGEGEGRVQLSGIPLTVTGPGIGQLRKASGPFLRFFDAS